jgi:acyl-CoA thioesterase
MQTVSIDRSWWSWAGAHGGHLAGLGLAEMRAELGEDRPVRSLTTHFLAPVDDRDLSFSAQVERAGRGTAMASFRARQDGATALHGSAVFGVAGTGPRHGHAAPDVPPIRECEPLALPVELAPFSRHLEIRPATPDRPLAGGDRAELAAWMRFVDGRSIDAEAVVVLTDALPPALFALWRAPRPVPSAELTVHFGESLADVGDWALVRIRTEHAASGWAVDDSAVWSTDGRLLALARQARRVL